jgi:protease IV
MGIMRFVRKLFIGLLALVGAVAVLSILAGLFFTRYIAEVEEPVPDQTVLTLDLADGLMERAPEGPLAWTGIGRALTIRDLVVGLEAASRDVRVKGLVARLGNGTLGLARAQEIRDAVIAFRQSGKFAIAFAETFGEAGDGNTHYFLATGFDEIWVQPSGDVSLTGLFLESPYLKTALDGIGITARIDQREEYKGAMDPLTKDAMPPPVRENYQRLADSWVDQVSRGIADARHLEVAATRTLIDRGPFLAPEAKDERLVDMLGYWDELQAAVDKRVGPDAKRFSLAKYADRLSVPRDAPAFAVVYGIGPIQLAKEDVDPLAGDATMAAVSVAKTLRDAADDPGVQAIIFRVDSPGGSYVASDTIWREVVRAKEKGKPVIVSMGDVAASGGYFVAAPATKIVAEPGTITGSIGVLSGKVILSGLWEKLGIKWEGVEAGTNAGIESVNHDYSPEEWSRLQTSLDRVYADFTGKVADGRKLTADQVHDVAKGQVWSGADGKQKGLVDELGGFTVAIRLAREAVGIGPDVAVAVEQYPRPDTSFTGFLRRLSDGEELAGTEARDFAALARLARVLAPIADTLAPASDSAAAGQLRMPALQRNE